jgi:hypothetical protein
VTPGGLLRQSPVHTCVIEQYVEPAGALLDQRRGRGVLASSATSSGTPNASTPASLNPSHRSLATSFVTGADADARAEGTEASRGQLGGEHAVVQLIDAPPVATVIAWPPQSTSLALAALVRTVVRL